MNSISNSQQINDLIHKIILDQQNAMNQNFSKNDKYTPQQMMILAFIAKNPGSIQRDIVKIVGRKPATVSILLKNMEKDDLIERIIPGENNRSKTLYITQKGQALVDEFEKAKDITQKASIRNLSEKEQETLIFLLDKVNR